MPESFQLDPRRNERQTIYQTAVDRLTVDRQGAFTDLGFNVKDLGDDKIDPTFNVAPLNQVGQLFQQEADLSQQAGEQDLLQGGQGVGSGGLFRQAQAGVRKEGDIGRLGLIDQLSKTQAAFVTDRDAEKEALRVDNAQYDIDDALAQQLDPYETAEEAADPEVPAGSVTFTHRGKPKTFTSKKKLIAFLKAKGKKPAEWAKNHPEDARQMGMKVPGDNTPPPASTPPKKAPPKKASPAPVSKGGKQLTPAQIRRWNAKHPKSKRFK